MADQTNFKPVVVPIYFHPKVGKFYCRISIDWIDRTIHTNVPRMYIQYHVSSDMVKYFVQIHFEEIKAYPLFIDCFPTKKAQPI